MSAESPLRGSRWSDSAQGAHGALVLLRLEGASLTPLLGDAWGSISRRDPGQLRGWRMTECPGLAELTGNRG